MSNLMIFEEDEVEKIKIFEDDKKNNNHGVFYVIEYDDNLVKIGYSTHPYLRYKQLNHIVKDYLNYSLKRIAISKYHANYIQNEHILHKYFKDFRKQSTELFYLSFVDTVQAINKINIKFEFKNESEKSNFLIKFVDNLIFNYPNNTIGQYKNNQLQKIVYNGWVYRSTVINNEIWFVLEDICKILEILPDYYEQIKKTNEAHLKGIINGLETVIIVDQLGLYFLINYTLHQKMRDIEEWKIVEVIDDLFIDICLHNNDYFAKLLFRVLIERMKTNAWIIDKQKEILNE